MTKKIEQFEGQFVRKETLYLVTLLSLAVGFFGGVMFGVFKSSSSISVQQPIIELPPAPGLSASIAALEKEVSSNSSNVNAWIELGNTYFDSDQYDKSIYAYRKALELEPSNADVWTDMGVMYRRAGQPQEAIKAFDSAIQADPTHEISRLNKGIVLWHDLGDEKGAVEAWEGLLKVNPFAMAPSGISVDQMVTQMKKQLRQRDAPE